jgi:CubicO group peptidase (beta-lactamase class C family)
LGETGLKHINLPNGILKNKYYLPMKRILLFLLLNVAGFAQQKQFNKIDSLLIYLNQNNKFMGQVSIREGEKLVFEKAYGFADVEKNQQSNEVTQYRIGSITKMFTSVMILQLIEEKKLKLDTKLAAFYPQIKNADKITINNLLHHRSGIFNITNDEAYPNFRTTENSRESILERLSKYEPLFEPDTKSDYSNSNYIILGFIIEDVTKKKYQEVVNTKIINPLRLKNTQFGSAIETSKNQAYSYIYGNKVWQKQPEENMSLPQGAGALISTTSDLTAFINTLFTGKLIKKTSLDEMIKMEQGYGKGIFKMPFGDKIFYGHNGGIDSFRSILQYYPKEKLSISIILNGGDFESNNILIGILSIYYKMPYQFPNVKTYEVDNTTLNNYQGTYASGEIPLKITIKNTNGKLIAQATGQKSFPLTPISKKEFVFDTASIKMIFDNKKMILKQGGQTFNFTKE